MSKYTIEYACGHQGDIQIFGGNSERQAKIEWMETRDCPECWKKARQEEEAAKPITYNIYCNGFIKDESGYPLIEIAITGGSYVYREKIKEMGYRYGEIHGGFLDMFSPKHAKAWLKTVSFKNFDIEAIKKECASFNGTLANKLSIIDMANLQESTLNAVFVDNEITKLEKPVKPDCYPSGKWNGLIYSNNRIFVGGDEVSLSNDDARVLKRYIAECNQYDNDVAAIRNGKTADAIAIEKESQKAAIDALKKPVKPDCYPSGKWNGKYYKGNRIFVDGNEVKLSKEQVEAIKDYHAAIDRSIKAIEEIKNTKVIVTMLSPIEIEMGRRKNMLAPIEPECYPDGRWDGKVYGNCIYVDAQEIVLSENDIAEIQKFGKAVNEYRSRIR
jgi:hypothetical protein